MKQAFENLIESIELAHEKIERSTKAIIAILIGRTTIPASLARCRNQSMWQAARLAISKSSGLGFAGSPPSMGSFEHSTIGLPGVTIRHERSSPRYDRVPLPRSPVQTIRAANSSALVSSSA